MEISEEERDALYKVIFSRRDVRREFLPKEVPEEALLRILNAAHHAPSVGFMQPWDFIVVKNDKTKMKIKEGFDIANAQSEAQFSDDLKEKYKKIKLEGITEAPLGICVTCDRNRNGPVVIGRTIKPEMDLYSTVCAIQNMWLAARAENLGMGWVSIIQDSVLKDVLEIPEEITIVAYLCIGYVSEFNDKPDLEKYGWLPRADIKDLMHSEVWSPKKS